MTMSRRSLSAHSIPHISSRASSTRPHGSRNTTASSIPFVQQAESLILDGPLGEEATELLTDFVHHRQDQTLVADDDDSVSLVNEQNLGGDGNKPWWKRPSPYWLIGLMLVTALATGMTIAPRIEIFTLLACSVHKPEVFELMPIDVNSPYIFPPKIPLSLGNGTTRTLISVETAGTNAAHGYDDKYKLCAKDPQVQAAVAQLTAVLTTTLGILSCLTTSWWGTFSDRWGRTRVMGIAIMGVLVTDFTLILVALFPQSIPGGYWFLIIGPIADGFVGGVTTAAATMHAYIADTTTSSNRSRMFSLSLGLMFIGIATGPTLGSLLIRVTQSTLAVFYFAAFVHVVYAFLSWFVVPESLTKQEMLGFREKYMKEELAELRDRELERVNGTSWLTKIAGGAKRSFKFLAPLGIFLPKRDPSRPGRNCNLLLIALGYGFTVSLMASYPFKFQYAAAMFGWTSETLGYFMSLVGAARAVFLSVVLPIIIKVFGPKPKPVHDPSQQQTESTPLLTSSGSAESRTRSSNPDSLRELHSPSFDLKLARVSLLIEAVAYAFMGHAPTPLSFTLFGMLGSFGTGFTPAIQSVAMELFMADGENERGKLFGALSVVQALSSQILGPTIYGFTYMQTVETYPRTIFFVSVAAVIISFVVLSFIRLPKPLSGEGYRNDFEAQALSRDETLGEAGSAGTLPRRDSHKPMEPPVVTVTSPSN